jgi:hypothetical protein
MSKYWTLSHENVEARIVLSPHNIKLLLFNLEWRFKLPSTEENKLNFGIKTNHIMMLDDHNAKVQFFLSNFILLSASVVFFCDFVRQVVWRLSIRELIIWSHMMLVIPNVNYLQISHQFTSKILTKTKS